MKRSDKGFTLIELMIVVAIIAIIAAIAIPSLLRSKMSANHTNAGAALKSLVTHEAVWRGQDIDKNTVADYWVGDVSAFHYAQDAGTNKVAFIDQQFANADKSPALLTTITVAAKQGYYYKALTSDDKGNAYRVGTAVGSGLLPAVYAVAGVTNVSKFGFSAYPAAYNTDGTLTFCVKEDGVIWQKDIASSTGVTSYLADGPGASGWAQFGQ